MTTCKHAAAGCNYPEAECPGLCMPETYLTIVYRITHPAQPRALLEQAEWSAASHTNAIQERDKLQSQLDAANKACNKLAAHVDDLLKQRDHWYARLLAEVGKRNKPEAT